MRPWRNRPADGRRPGKFWLRKSKTLSNGTAFPISRESPAVTKNIRRPSFVRESESVPLKSYPTQKRLSKAERLLPETTYTVAEIACFLNFRNPHNFSRFFKQRKGISPVEYRKTKKIGNEQEP